MKIDVEIGFSFKRELDEGYGLLELPEGTDVETAIRTWVARHPSARERLFDGTGRLRRHVNALVNGGNVTLREGFQTVLHQGDCLTLLPPVGGG